MEVRITNLGAVIIVLAGRYLAHDDDTHDEAVHCDGAGQESRKPRSTAQGAEPSAKTSANDSHGRTKVAVVYAPRTQ
jgi:hypothetical protein